LILAGKAYERLFLKRAKPFHGKGVKRGSKKVVSCKQKEAKSAFGGRNTEPGEVRD